MSYSDLYIVDNSSEQQSVKQYLHQWCGISKQMDIATGYWEIGGLLSLDGEWQKLEKIRIILGNEVTKRTRDVIDEVVHSLLNCLKKSVDTEQETNEFLVGVPAIVHALKTRKIECRVFDKSKFHAKAYITYFRDDYRNQFISSMNVPEGYALVGSSNFTRAGLTQNIELNVQVQNDVEQLQSWFDDHWNQGEDITSAVLETIEVNCKEFSPYDVYLRSMYEYFKTKEETVSEWENKDSKVYSILSQYQKDGYNSLVQIADKYSGAFLCDGVGLGKTFVGLMLIERYVIKERKNVVLIVPASARVSVWETTIKKYIPEIFEGFSSFKIINHTDLLLESKENEMEQIAARGEIVIIDEAHNFRNRSSNRYRKLFDMMNQGYAKKMFMLTATPINNSFLDLQHMIELFTHRDDTFFNQAPLGINSLSGHFKKMENALLGMTASAIQDSIDINNDVFRSDKLVNELVVQRSRAYVKKSLSLAEGQQVMFSVRQAPTVANYSLKTSYGKLIDDFVESFFRKDQKTGREIPILALAVYSPYEDQYFIGDRSKIDEMKSGRQNQVVNLIRQLLLKRFESSIAAFQETCLRIYVRLKKFVIDYKSYGNVKQLDRFLTMQSEIISYVSQYIDENLSLSEEELEDDLPKYVWDVEENLNVNDFDINAMLDDTVLDMTILASFIKDMMGIKPENDDKLRELKRILTEDEHLHGRKVIIFTEYAATAKYLYKELVNSGFEAVDEIDGKKSLSNRSEFIKRFAPYYNDTCSADIKDEISILISTDVLAEGLNLQDAQCLINYELHWNPVKLMQRIGRVDRRRSAATEAKLLADHSELTADRENAYYWNFLPPVELEKLLSLYHTVSKKTLRISKTFGIEGKKLLTPEDDYDALKEFNSQYEGDTSAEEEISLEYLQLLKDNPDYPTAVLKLPKKMYSGKTASTRSGFFFCYELPIKRADDTWSDGDGQYKWYLLDNKSGAICESPFEAWKAIKCNQEEPRQVTVSEKDFSACKKNVEDYLKKNYLRQVQAPIGIKPRLVTWMQLC